MVARLQINEEKPTPLLRDFRTFLEYLDKNQITLTQKNKHLRGKDLFHLNEMMSQPQEGVTTRTFQTTYPQLHLFYHLVLAGDLFHINNRGSRSELKPTENLRYYHQILNPVEKYFFLLETLWVDSNWRKLNQHYFAGDAVPSIKILFNFLQDQPPGASFDSSTFPEVIRVVNSLGSFMVYLAMFGLYTLDLEYELMAIPSKRAYGAERITLTSFGVELIPLLASERPVKSYNFPYMRENGIDAGILGKRSELKVDFINPFIPLFPEGELQNTIPRKEYSFCSDNHIFKITLGRETWRKIRISGTHTLHNLHQWILSAFGFTNGDHLYAFFMEGKAWEGLHYSSPHSLDGITADEKKIGELGLEVGSEFLYLFDFGDEWKFRVQLIAIEEGKESEPAVIESRGTNPEQYPSHF